MKYIASPREAVEKEYQEVLQHAEGNCQYWEIRNRGRQEQIAHRPAKLGQEKIRARLQDVKARLVMERHSRTNDSGREYANPSACNHK